MDDWSAEGGEGIKDRGNRARLPPLSDTTVLEYFPILYREISRPGGNGKTVSRLDHNRIWPNA